MSERRYKDRSEFTMDEEAAFQKSRTVPERSEYVELRRQALENAGLEDNAPGPEKALEDMTPDDHFDRIRSH